MWVCNWDWVVRLFICLFVICGRFERLDLIVRRLKGATEIGKTDRLSSAWGVRYPRSFLLVSRFGFG